MEAPSPCDLQAAGLGGRKDGLVKRQLKLLTGTTSSARWPKALSQAFVNLDEQPVGLSPHVSAWEPLVRHPTLKI